VNHTNTGGNSNTGCGTMTVDQSIHVTVVAARHDDEVRAMVEALSLHTEDLAKHIFNRLSSLEEAGEFMYRRTSGSEGPPHLQNATFRTGDTHVTENQNGAKVRTAKRKYVSRKVEQLMGPVMEGLGPKIPEHDVATRAAADQRIPEAGRVAAAAKTFRTANHLFRSKHVPAGVRATTLGLMAAVGDQLHDDALATRICVPSAAGP
jgi:hypothetical protein